MENYNGCEYEERTDTLRTSVESLEASHIPVTITSIHQSLEGRFSLSEVRELAQELYGYVPETVVSCSGCPGGWCKGCVPDASLFEDVS